MNVHDEGRALVQEILDRKGVKLCVKCNLTKPFSEFQASYRRKDGSKGLRTECKRCQNDRRNEWRHSNPTGEAQIKEYDDALKYQAKHQEETLETATSYKEVWTQEQDEFLINNAHVYNRYLAELLGRTYTAVARRKTVLRKRGKL